MQVVIAGDVFVGGDAQKKWFPVQIHSKTFATADIRIVNLEHPLSDHSECEDKGVLYASSEATATLKKFDIDAVNLANNHIHDKKEKGIRDTLSNLEQMGIGHFGAGMSLWGAKQPCWITDSLCIMGYCVQDKPTLTRIKVATEGTAGVNPCTYTEIEHDLANLPEGKKAIIYCHWGREHVWIASRYVVDLAKKLLDHEKVALVVGSHPHLVQGVFRHDGKCAYLSLGNFLFSNFYIAPPTQLAHPEEKVDVLTTRKYHCVRALTYKMWPLWNRVSIMVQYDTATGDSSYISLVQDDKYPVVHEMGGVSAGIVRSWIDFLSTAYSLPASIYSLLELGNALWVNATWVVGINLFYIRQKGLRWFLSKLLRKLQKEMFM